MLGERYQACQRKSRKVESSLGAGFHMVPNSQITPTRSVLKKSRGGQPRNGIPPKGMRPASSIEPPFEPERRPKGMEEKKKRAYGSEGGNPHSETRINQGTRGRSQGTTPGANW